MPIWSKSSRFGAGKKEEVQQKDAPAERSEELIRWLDAFSSVTGPDTLLRFAPTPEGVISLDDAHPSGLAQLMAGRKTRLSTLIRDPQQYSAAARAAKNVRAKIFELSQDRGLDVGYLGAGTAVWTSAVGGKAQRVSAPVLLAAVSLSLRPAGDDYEIHLLEQAQLNPALVRHLRSVHGLVFDAAAVARLAYSTARFDPIPVLDRIQTVINGIPGAEVSHGIYVSTFSDLPQGTDDHTLNDSQPLIHALASGDLSAADQTFTEADFESLDDRDPATEFLVLDADRSQQLVLDVASADHSVVVSAPSGSGQTRTAVNLVSRLAFEGKSVLVVAERRSTQTDFLARINELGLDSLVLPVTVQLGPVQLRNHVISAITRNEKAPVPDLAQLHSTLKSRRHALVDHVSSLHNVRERWGCSPYEAMQALANVVADPAAPATTVRLKRSVLDSIRDREQTTARLIRAAELDSFVRATVSSPWHGARLLTRKEASEAHDVATRLALSLPALHARMESLATQAHIRLGNTVAAWGEQLELLMGMRDSLSRFSVEIFDRDVHDFIAATASGSWRRERGIEMTSLGRAKLRRYAKEFIRPGVHIADLHESLKELQGQRAQWAKHAISERHPVVPTGLADLSGAYNDVMTDLGLLAEALRGTVEGHDLANAPVQPLRERIMALSLDAAALENLPERTLTLDELRGQGLGELLDDLAERQVPADAVAAELDLAWWQSVLEAMISGDDYLAMSDGANLRRLEGEFRLADGAHVASGASRLNAVLAERWRTGLESEPRQAGLLRALLKDGRVTLDALTAQAPHLHEALSPVWMVSPHLLARLLPQDLGFDVVVLLDAESAPLQTVLPALARGAQVVSFGDPSTGAPRPFSVAVDTAEPSRRTSAPIQSAHDALARHFPVLELEHAYRSVDEDLSLQLSASFYGDRLERFPDGQTVTGLDRSLAVEYLAEGTGLPTPGREAVESVVAEVNRVVDLVFEHARTRPRQSLAVVTTTLYHAARIGEAIRAQMPNHPALNNFFLSTGPESFRVVDLERAQGLVRDSIIFSLGFGRTPHGRALHSFGPLSGAQGRQYFALAMTRARSNLRVLSCFKPEDLDRSRLANGAADFFDLLDRELGGNFSLGSQTSRAAQSDRLLTEDALVADLADRLRVRGARVWHDYDGVIDVVAAADPLHVLGQDDADVPTPVALDSDGTENYRRMSVRERSRLRPQQLELMGWRHVSLWTIEVFTDPSSTADRIAAFLHLDQGAGDSPAETTGFMQAVSEVPEPELLQSSPAEPVKTDSPVVDSSVDDPSAESAAEPTDKATDGEPAEPAENAEAPNEVASALQQADADTSESGAASTSDEQGAASEEPVPGMPPRIGAVLAEAAAIQASMSGTETSGPEGQGPKEPRD